MVAYSYGYKFKKFPVGAVSTSFSCSDWSRLRTLASKAYITSGSGLHKILLNSAFLKIAALWFCIITLHVLDIGPIFQVSDLSDNSLHCWCYVFSGFLSVYVLRKLAFFKNKQKQVNCMLHTLKEAKLLILIKEQ